MKQVLIPKPDIHMKAKFHAAHEESLKILTCNNDALYLYLREQVQQNPYLRLSGHKDVDADAYLAYASDQRSLSDEVFGQLQLMDVAYDSTICEFLFSQLDSNGYFKVSFDELCKQSGILPTILRYHLDLVHQVEPYGAFAFDLRECLQLQCDRSEHPASETAYDLCNYLEEIALKQYALLTERLELSMEEIQEGLVFLRSLNPKPTANYAQHTVYVNPEFKLTIEEEELKIELLNDDLSITFHGEESSKNEEVNAYLKTTRKQVANIMSTIQKRNLTLLQIMHYICEVQQAYFLYHAPLQHLTLSMIATHCNLHSSTISRAIANKSFEFENRYLPLRTMLSHGGTLQNSKDDIRKEILTIIEEEDPLHPYSDEAIRQKLQEQGIHVSRRLVTKYREACFIYNSSKRKLQKQG